MKQNPLYKYLRIYRLACAERETIQTQPAFQYFFIPRSVPSSSKRKLLSNVFESQWHEKKFQ